MLKAYQQRRHLPVSAPQGDPLIGTLGSIAGTAIGAAMGGPAGAAAGGALGSQLGNVVSGAPVNPTEMAVSGLTAGMTAGGNAAKTATADMMEAKDALTTAFEQAGGTAAGEAAYNSEAYKSALDKLKSAGSKAMEAEASMFNDPFGKAGNAVKSGFNTAKNMFNSMFDDDPNNLVVHKADGGKAPRGSVFDDMSKLEKFTMLSSPLAMASNTMGIRPEKMMLGPLASMLLSEGGKAKQPKRDREGRIIREELPENLDFSKMRLAPLTKLTEAQKQEEASVRQQLEARKKKPSMLAKGGKACCGKVGCGCSRY